MKMRVVEALPHRWAANAVGIPRTTPAVGKTAQAVVATGRLEDSLHVSMMTILQCLCKTMAPASSALHLDNRHAVMTIWTEFLSTLVRRRFECAIEATKVLPLLLRDATKPLRGALGGGGVLCTFR